MGRVGTELRHHRAPGTQIRRRLSDPVTAFATDDGVAILLTYGPDRDWLKNLQAAGGGSVQRGGKTRTVVDPRVVPRDEAAPLVHSRTFARLPFDQAVLLTYA